MSKSKKQSKREESIKRGKRRTLRSIVTHGLVALGGVAVGLGAYHQFKENLGENEIILGRNIRHWESNFQAKDFNEDGMLDYFFEIVNAESGNTLGSHITYSEKGINGIGYTLKMLDPESNEYEIIKEMASENQPETPERRNNPDHNRERINYLLR